MSSSTNFSWNGTINLANESQPSFLKFIDIFVFNVSVANNYISNLLSKRDTNNYKPFFFNIPYIYSVRTNLIDGNYTSSISNENNLVITTYKVPYKGQFKEEIVTIVTYLNQSTKILFYEIPNELSYNSKESASVAITDNDIKRNGKLNIPASFISDNNDPNNDFKLDFKVNDNNTAVPSDTVSGTASCRKQYAACPLGPSQCCKGLCGPVLPQYPSPVCII